MVGPSLLTTLHWLAPILKYSLGLDPSSYCSWSFSMPLHRKALLFFTETMHSPLGGEGLWLSHISTRWASWGANCVWLPGHMGDSSWGSPEARTCHYFLVYSQAYWLMAAETQCNSTLGWAGIQLHLGDCLSLMKGLAPSCTGVILPVTVGVQHGSWVSGAVSPVTHNVPLITGARGYRNSITYKKGERQNNLKGNYNINIKERTPNNIAA